MTQNREVRGVHTTTFVDAEGFTNIIYRGTAVVRFNERTIILNSGDWRTVTTKLRMNQAANQYRLGFQVRQRDWDWFVIGPCAPQGGAFEDGMEMMRL